MNPYRYQTLDEYEFANEHHCNASCAGHCGHCGELICLEEDSHWTIPVVGKHPLIQTPGYITVCEDCYEAETKC